MKRNIITGEMFAIMDPFKNATNLIFKGAQCCLSYCLRCLAFANLRMIILFMPNSDSPGRLLITQAVKWNSLILLFRYRNARTSN